MQPRKYDLMLCVFAYGGNGGIATTNPYLIHWTGLAVEKLKADQRIGKILYKVYSDTPITMMRNRAAIEAIRSNSDLLVMIDSDNIPDHYLDERDGAKPFLPTAIDFIDKRFQAGPVVIGAPYCGPPDHENIYVFDWENRMSNDANPDWRLSQVGRLDASRRRGIMEAAALATGVSIWDVRLFKLTEPKTKDDPPWFDYEYEDVHKAYKCSTEDVYASRNFSLAGIEAYGYNPIFCNWDAWAAHIKQKIVGPPIAVEADRIHKTMRDAVIRNHRSDEKLVFIGADSTEFGSAPSMPTKKTALSRPRFEDGELSDRWKSMGVTVVRGHKFVRLGWHGEESHYDALFRLVSSLPKSEKMRAVELGSWVGESALQIIYGLPDDATLYCVDHFLGSETDASGPSDETYKVASHFGAEELEAAFRGNMGNLLNKRVFLKKMSSLEFVDSVEDGSLDFLYVDDDHRYESVKAELAAWLPKMKPTGMMAGHDFSLAFPGVVNAVYGQFGKSVKVMEDAPIWYVNMFEYMSSELVATNGEAEG